MKKVYSRRILTIVIAMTVLACFAVPSAFAAGKTYTVTFSTGTTATVNVGEEFVFHIACQPPTDITTITASGGTLTAEKTSLGGPSEPQGVINGLWAVSDITGDVTITLDLNTQEGADLPVITIGREEAEAALASGGGMGGGPGGGAPGEGGGPGGGAPGEGGGPGGTPPTGAPSGPPSN